MSTMKLNDNDLEQVTGGTEMVNAYLEKRYCATCKEKTDHKILSGDRAYCLVCNSAAEGVAGKMNMIK